MVGIFLVPNFIKTLTTSYYIVVHYIHTIEATNSDNGLFFIITRTLFVFPAEFGKFAFEYNSQEIAVTASRFQETGVGSQTFVCNKVAHSVYLTFGSKDLAPFGNTLFRFYLIIFFGNRHLQPS